MVPQPGIALTGVTARSWNAPAPALIAPQDPELANPLRQVAFASALALVFLRYSLLHELLAHSVGTSVYLLYLFAIPALVGVAGSGGIPRTLTAAPAKYWMGFVAWLLLSVPFSSWRGESVSIAFDYLRTDVPMLFVMAGLALTWKECRRILLTMGAAGICNIAVSIFISKNYGDRIGLDFGIVANPNDYAGHLLLVLPLIAFLMIFPPSRSGPLRLCFRLAGAVAIFLGLRTILLTGSRGAFIALGVGTLFVLWKSSTRVRLVSIVVLPILFFVLFAAVPSSVRDRLQLINPGGENDKVIETGEAEESGRLRKKLLDESVRVSFQHPLFGVGLAEFVNFEGKAAFWHATHNSFTEVSSECGIPALLFFLAGMISGLRMVQRTWKRAKLQPQFREIAIACYCVSLSFLMFCAAIFFLNFAYFFYLPAAIGLFIVLNRCAQQEFALVENNERRGRPTATLPHIPPVPEAPAAAAIPRRTIRFNRHR